MMKNFLQTFNLLLVMAVFLYGCNDDPNTDPTTKPPTDTIPETPSYSVKIVSPQQNKVLTFGDTLPLQSASYYDDKTLTKVTYMLDGKTIGEGDSTYTLHYPLTDITGGRHELSVKGTYADGSEGTQLVFFNVISDVVPANYDYRVVNTFPHDNTAYTQGLEFKDGQLYESTGLENGRSSIRKVKLQTGEVEKLVTLDKQHFAEGMTFWGDEVYQLTYTSQICFVYDKDLNKLTQHVYAGQGWGLSHNETHLIMSDGSAQIRFLNPGGFDEIKRITVYDNNGPVTMINELEYVNGELYANIYQTDKIAKIDPETGKVLAYMHMEGLLTRQQRSQTDVLNGIAHENGKFYVTGKLWPHLFEVVFTPRMSG